MNDDLTESIQALIERRIPDTHTDRDHAADLDDLSTEVANIWAELLDPHDDQVVEALESIAAEHGVTPMDPYDDNDPYTVLKYQIYQDWCTQVLVTALRKLAATILSTTEGV